VFSDSDVPGPIHSWAEGTDGAQSNTLWDSYIGGSQNFAVVDPNTGELYYYSPGNGNTGSGSILTFKSDGTQDTTYQSVVSGSPAFGYDPATHYIFLTDSTGIDAGLLNGTSITGAGGFLVGEVASFAVNDSHVCALQPDKDKAYFFAANQADLPTAQQVIATIAFPSGNYPVAAWVLDSSHVVVYTAGNSTLNWFTVSGTTVTAGKTLATQFTPRDASYQQNYPYTGGWEIVQVGSTLGVIGKVINQGLVSEQLALVNNQTVSQYVDLPLGTDRIAADPADNAVIAEYQDYSVSPPVTKFVEIYVDTGIPNNLSSTSNLFPGVAFAPMQDNTHVAVCVEGGCDFPLKQ
jgi:hypothetical protein